MNYTGTVGRGGMVPWAMVALALALTVGVIFLARERIAQERGRSATTRQNNEDLNTALKSARAALEHAKETTNVTEKKRAEAAARVEELEKENATLRAEAEKACAPPARAPAPPPKRKAK
jgi:hypothetical protein